MIALEHLAGAKALMVYIMYQSTQYRAPDTFFFNIQLPHRYYLLYSSQLTIHIISFLNLLDHGSSSYATGGIWKIFSGAGQLRNERNIVVNDT